MSGKRIRLSQGSREKLHLASFWPLTCASKLQACLLTPGWLQRPCSRREYSDVRRHDPIAACSLGKQIKGGHCLITSRLCQLSRFNLISRSARVSRNQAGGASDPGQSEGSPSSDRDESRVMNNQHASVDEMRPFRKSEIYPRIITTSKLLGETTISVDKPALVLVSLIHSILTKWIEVEQTMQSSVQDHKENADPRVLINSARLHSRFLDHNGGMPTDAFDDSTLSGLREKFEDSLLVHRGKPGLEMHMPNPYTANELPPQFKKYSKNPLAIMQNVDEDRLPHFFEVLEENIKSSTLQENSSIHSAVKASTKLSKILENKAKMMLKHPQWGTADFAKQIFLEQRGYEIGMSIYRKGRAATEMRGKGGSMSAVENLLLTWLDDVQLAVRRHQEAYVSRTFKQGEFVRFLIESLCCSAVEDPALSPFKDVEMFNYNMEQSISKIQTLHESDDEGIGLIGPILMSLPASKIAVITIHELLSSLLSGGGQVHFVRAARTVGEGIQAELGLEHVKKAKNRFLLSSRRLSALCKAHDVRKLNKLLSRLESQPLWDARMQVKVGAKLIQILMNSAKYKGSAAVTHVVQAQMSNKGMRKKGFLALDQEILQDLEKQHDSVAAHNPLLLPMIIRPFPWMSFDVGCYIQARTKVMRIVDKGLQEESCRNHDLSRIYAALDVLSGTGWCINRRLLNVVQHAWLDDMILGEIPQKDDFAVPELDPDCIDAAESYSQYREKKRVEQRNKDLHSLRCSLINQLHVATTMSDFKEFFFPHNLDFRGRAYPIPPHLNHLGSDICRGLLKFSKKKPLGKKGFYWLKVHLANLFGENKISYDDRVKWTEERMSQILHSAKNPLDSASRKFWLSADDPWQALATSMEIQEAIESGDPSTYLSNLPVHQDGSCNGLQHYAALGLDEIGGEQVNLVPGEKPSDPYTTVCNRVLEALDMDLRDPSSADHEVSKLVDKRVSRKVVKQTVMTTVYGVTFIGAREQIYNRLYEAYGIPGTNELQENDLYRASMYLAKLTLASVGNIFVGARKTMEWLTSVAKIVASTGQPVRWTTPLGLPVVQPYYKETMMSVETAVQNISLLKCDENGPINKLKQRTAFPPNFVHSLDSTHLLMTAIEFDRRGKTFAGVHDSFWTHACDYEELALVLREQFVHLYTQPILNDLKNSFERDYPTIGRLPVPLKGRLDINVVKQSPYFFS
ncbi:RNA polymerase, single subunit, mitochondrial [Guillardia theta CCMP2712]|uniref:DNA-directed RNA polymerase n=1 Tax=Guillardia theta (strain CCMP2712) TaxID=905079 RepID=L1K266_GUITC|nr:RNA polymerase, single subunit, mitochondrial [Guillardia theta CCMP2712]EKX54674.1 RNA polymerase, single subunit, mitochondrial [Guillardia theta CCMP2712]|eukprot:XP_005841654.1 RNA polymerase, single subunit, mitochondrial [Guillardia theta CCMP2712]